MLRACVRVAQQDRAQDSWLQNWAPRGETARRIRSKSGNAPGAARTRPIPSQAAALVAEGVETGWAAPTGGNAQGEGTVQTTNAAGQVVQQVADTSGAVLEVTRDASGNIVNLRVLQQATGGQPAPNGQ